MGSNRRWKAVAAAGCALLSAVLWYGGTGLHPVWWLTWVAPVSVLLAAHSVRSSNAFFIAAVAYSVGSMNMLRYLHSVVHIPLLLVLAFLLVPSVVFALVTLMHRHLLRHRSWWTATVVPAAVWTLYEYGMSIASPHGTFGSVAYSQMDFLPVLQIASVGGFTAVTFLLMAVPLAMVTVMVARGRNGSLGTGTGVAVVALAVLAWGTWRLRAPISGEPRIKAVLMASDADASPNAALLSRYADEVARVSAGSASVILLPEKIAVLPPGSDSTMDATLGRAAAASHAVVIAGVDRTIPAQGRVNEARVYSPHGGPVSAYVKHHLIPGLEDIDRPGSSRLVISQPWGRFGVAICKDLDFPKLIREYGRDGIGVLMVPAWDFRVDGWLHGRMAVMRGVEGGFSVVRSAKQGMLAVSDNRGRVLRETSSAGEPFANLSADVPVSHAVTVYARLGDWFPLTLLFVLSGIAISRALFSERHEWSSAAASRPRTDPP